MSKGAEPKKLLKLSHAAELYDIPERTLRDACLLGKLQATKIGDRWYVTPAEMDRLAREGFRTGE